MSQNDTKEQIDYAAQLKALAMKIKGGQDELTRLRLEASSLSIKLGVLRTEYERLDRERFEKEVGVTKVKVVSTSSKSKVESAIARFNSMTADDKAAFLEKLRTH
jgi:predicted nuclease with TOPRIM domain